MSSRTDDGFEAKFQAALDALSVEERAQIEPDWARLAQRVSHFRNYQKDLCRRLGFKGPVTWHLLLQTARSVGLSPKQFAFMTPGQLCSLLDAKATALEQLRDLGTSGEPSERFWEAVMTKGGRPPGTSVNGERLKELRGHISQDALAFSCNVSVDTIFRGEAGGRWGDSVFDKVADGLTEALGRQVTPQDLKNYPQ